MNYTAEIITDPNMNHVKKDWLILKAANVINALIAKIQYH